MNILIVGAGAVGKVYGRHLAMGGAKISFFVKEKYADPARAGFNFYALNDSKYRHTPVFWKDFEVVTDGAAVQKQKWDFVLLSMSSTALRSGWLDEFMTWVPNADIVTLQPGLIDKDYLLERVPASRLIDGTIHLLSFDAPLNGESLPVPGTAYWFPPGTFAAFSGDTPHLKPLLQVFKRGKFTVKQVADARKLNVVAAPALSLAIYGLKKCNWSLDQFSRSDWLDRVIKAIPEAVSVQAKKVGVPTPPTFFLKKPFFLSLFWLTKNFVPFDFEAYVKKHFLKVDDQMIDMLNDLIAFAEKGGLAMTELKKLKSTARAG